MQPCPGTYALILRAASRQNVQVGRLGRLAMQPGFYVYVGSALGPGGLKARVGHHLRPVKRPHWHIDYLRRETECVAVWYAYGTVRQECAWADAFSSLRGSTIPLPGFGSSDCRCSAHLYFFDRMPLRPIFRNAPGAGNVSSDRSYASAGCVRRVRVGPAHPLRQESRADRCGDRTDQSRSGCRRWGAFDATPLRPAACGGSSQSGSCARSANSTTA